MFLLLFQCIPLCIAQDFPLGVFATRRYPWAVFACSLHRALQRGPPSGTH